jgi:hypothetical protein
MNVVSSDYITRSFLIYTPAEMLYLFPIFLHVLYVPSILLSFTWFLFQYFLKSTNYDSFSDDLVVLHSVCGSYMYSIIICIFLTNHQMMAYLMLWLEQ